ncbi:YdcF family protein [Halorhodospira halochloris]|uniref:ElyC/SanA/YdcF family protein n=1 Tax=Halorhodospira halochloris TaxID=1052 RepID=UPI001EE8C4BD|nr:ElyC/SanA/YdcF family protein [Halorhodospira halochloris]MCG5529757.1 YdcF family protein [Halorhodospira halochloris]
MFELTKIIGALIMPLSMFFVLACGAVLLLFTKWYRLGRGALIATLLAIWVLSWDPTAQRLLAPLERQYPAILEPAETLGEEPGYIVVLGHGHSLDPELPITSQANSTAAVRLLEGLRIHNQLPQSTLILTGGSVFGSTPNSEVMHRLAQSIGIEPANEVVRFATPRNTREEATRVAEFLTNREAGQPKGRIVVVTEASHMPRAMALFRGAGLDPVAAPTRHRVRADEADRGFHPGDLRPSAHALRKSERAIHEYVGLLWARLRGWSG